MAAALAIRLALLREVSGIDVAFFDEPTANLDDERRDNLARQIMEIRGFSQLFVVSHDDTFEQDTDNVVRVIKEGGASRVWVEGQVAPPAEGLVDAFDGGPLFGEE
jgi:exonuclease SbcC